MRMWEYEVDRGNGCVEVKEKEARTELGKEFGVTVENEEVDLKGSILLDYLFDTFQFTVKKGIPWEQSFYIVKLAKEVLEASKGKQLADTIKIYTQKCKEYQAKISSKNLEACSNFIFESYMMHFKLFQYVFTKSRNEMTYEISKVVETPEEPQDFKTGKPEKIWNYEQKLKEIDDLLQQREGERQEKELQMNNNDKVKDIYDDLSIEPPMDLEKMRMLVQDVAKAHLTAATSHLNNNISQKMEDLQLMLEKSAVPKPRELGS